MALGSSRSYLIRALYDWIVDGGEDPYVTVDYFYPGVEVPDSHVKDGQIVLNLSPSAVTDWTIINASVVFQTRFGGIPTEIILPYGSITAIYGKESGLGMAFGQEPGGTPKLPISPPEFHSGSKESIEGIAKRARPPLRIVKPDD